MPLYGMQVFAADKSVSVLADFRTISIYNDVFFRG